MADWGGFTEEDLRQLAYPGKIDMENLQSIQYPPRKPSGGTPKKQASFGKQKGKNANRDRSFSQQKKRVTLSDVVEVMPVDQMLNPDSLSNGDAGSSSPVTNSKTKVSPTKPQNPKTPPKSVLKPSKPIERQVSRTNSDSLGNEGKLSDVSLNDVECSRELNEEEALNRELNQIQKFQHQQKLIEEKNKQTKNLLAQAIKERRARAESEAHLLTDLQKELSRLDTLLTTDVSIIRDKIETASLEYTESQKRYEKAEKEFVNAKMELFRRAETKEKLTEHLYTIIYQNEMRKAQKLSELMEMLELTTAGEEVECILPAIPPPMYNPMQTLGSSGKFPHTTKPSGADPTVEPDIDQKVENQLAPTNVPTEEKESVSEGSASSPPMSEIPKEGELKQDEPNTMADTNGDTVSSSLQNSSTPITAEVNNTVDLSVELIELPESESRKEDECSASLSGCNISDSDSMTENEKISSQSPTNDARTNIEKKTTLKELAK